jgi:hypothetical protein
VQPQDCIKAVQGAAEIGDVRLVRNPAADIRDESAASASGVIGWRNEMAAPDGSWFLIEEYSMVPVQVT